MDDSVFDRITIRQNQMGGVPCIRGLRIPVATVICMLADGMNMTEILEAFQDLEEDDILAAMKYAASTLRRPPDSDDGLGSLIPNP